MLTFVISCMFCSVGQVNDHVTISSPCDGKQHQNLWIRQLIKSLLHLMAPVSCMWLVLHFISTLTSSVTADLCYMKPAARVHVSLTHTSVSQHTPAATCCEAPACLLAFFPNM